MTTMTASPLADPTLPAAVRMSADLGFRFGLFTLLPRRRKLLREGQPMAVGGRAYDLLWLLVENHWRVVEKAEILDRVWERRCVEENNIPVQVARLRRLVGENSILTVPQRGYQFMADVLPANEDESSPEPMRSPLMLTAGPESPPPFWRSSAALFGRRDELETSFDLLQRHRGLTITGPVGVGKSAFARGLAQAWAGLNQPVAWLSPDAGDDEASVQAQLAAMTASWEADEASSAGRATTALRRPLVVLDEVERWSTALRKRAQFLLGQIHGLSLLSTCPGPLDGSNEPHFRLAPLLVPEQGRSLTEVVSTGRAGGPDSGWAHDMLRVRAAVQGAAAPPRWAQPSLGEARLCELLDGRPGLLAVASRWVSMADAERAAVWVLEDPSVIGMAKSSTEARSLVTALDHSVALLDERARQAYRELARPSHALTVDETLLLLRRRSMTQADALSAVADLLELNLIRRLDDPMGATIPHLKMAMPERWHALGCLATKADASPPA